MPSSCTRQGVVNGGASVVGVVAIVVTATVSACAPTVGATRVPGGRSEATPWSALARLPDWSGVWLPDLGDQFAQIERNPVPWTTTVAAKIARLNQLEAAGHPKGLFADCLPEGMPSWMLISHNAMEILFTPGRVTLLGESDGNRLRRIYTDGRSHPADPDPSFHGHSIGHWEGDTLVVDTVGILPQTYIAVSEAVGVPNNGDLHIVERFRLAAPGVLHDELQIVAPHVMTKPWTTVRRYRRQRGPTANIVEGVCLQGFFAEGSDENGDAIFTPVPQAEGGNPAPPSPAGK